VGEWDVAVINENFTIQVIAGRVAYRLHVVGEVNVNNTVREDTLTMPRNLPRARWERIFASLGIRRLKVSPIPLGRCEQSSP
jgi:hypothetical protein